MHNSSISVDGKSLVLLSEEKDEKSAVRAQTQAARAYRRFSVSVRGD
jgi:hypothetical protein